MTEPPVGLWPAPDPSGDPSREPAAEGEPEQPTERTFHRLSPLTPVVRGAIVVVAVAFTTWDDLLTGRVGTFALVMLAVLFAGAVYGFLSWLRTRYWIDDRELRIDTGVVYHQSRRIRIDRLQGVDIRQPFVARLLGLAELKMDVAGGDAEGSLAFLPLAEAHRVRQVLLERRDAVRRGREASSSEAPVGGPGAQDGESAHEGAPSWQAPEHDIAKLDLRTLVLSTVFSPETIALVIAAVALSVATWFGGVVLIAPGVPVIGGFAIVLVRKLSAYYDFTVSQTQAGLQVRRGLFERSTQTIALARVQGVVISEPLLWRRFGWAKLDVSVAGSGGVSESDGRPAATTVMPAAALEQVFALGEHLLRGDDTHVEIDIAAVELTPPPRSARWVDPVSRRFMGAGRDEELAVARSGWFTRSTHAIRHARVQSVRLSQGPIQRRLGLADVHLDSPPGPVQVRARHRAEDDARAIFEEEQRLAQAARVRRR